VGKLPRVVNRQPNRILSPASINRVIELRRHMMNWAVGREYLERTPFRRGTETLIRKQHEDMDVTCTLRFIENHDVVVWRGRGADTFLGSGGRSG